MISIPYYIQKTLPLALFPTIIVLDQFSKYLVNNLDFSATCNKGVAFGVGNVGIFIPLVTLAVVSWLLIKEKSPVGRVSLVLILSGGVSNIFDRVYFGCVRDFIAIGFFPAFNFADVVISAGAIGLVLSLIRRDRT